MGIVRTRSTATTLLLVDDDPDTHRIGKMLRSKGFRVRVAQSADRALDKLNLNMADVAVIDMKLGDESASDGLALAQQIRELNPSLPLIGMSAFLTAFEGRDRDVNIDQWLAKSDLTDKADRAAFLNELVDKINSAKVVVPVSPPPPSSSPVVDVIGVGRLLTEHLVREPALIHRLSPDEFEELVCERLSAMGMEARRVGGTYRKDGGIDIVFWPQRPTFPFLGAAQVRHHRTQKTKEGVGSVRDFAGAIAGQPFGAGVIVTNTSFTADAEWFARERAKLIRLRGYQDLRRWLLGDFTHDAEWREIPETIELCPGVSIDLRRQH